MTCSITIWLTVATAIAAIVNAVALIYDVGRRYQTKSVSHVQVPNENPGGLLIFKTLRGSKNLGAIVNSILINSDGSVEIESADGDQRTSCRCRFIHFSA